MTRKPRHSGTAAARRTLRAYALAGDRVQTEQVLLRLLEENPGDTALLAELSRLRSGAPLRITETREQQQEREAQERQNEVQQALSAYRDKQLDYRHLSTELLAQYTREADKLPAQEYLMSFRHALATELRHRQRRRVKRLAGISLGAILILSLATIGFIRHRTALHKSQALNQALCAGNWELVQSRLQEARQPPDRLLSRQLRHSIGQADRWLESQRLQRDTLLRQAAHWQASPQDFAALTEAQKAQYEEKLTALAYPHDDLQEAWQSLNTRHRETILAERSSVIAALAKPLPPQPATTGSPEADAQAYTAYRDELNRRIRFFEQARHRHPLSRQLIEPATQALRQAEQTLLDIRGLRRLTHDLQQARSYAHYRSLISSYAPTAYAPAVHLMETLNTLPSVQDLQQIIRDTKSHTDHEILQNALLHRGPTFTPAMPATQQQTAIIESIFTSEPLHRIFFQLRNAKGETCLSEQQPVVFSQTKGYHDAKIIRSTYDPAYSPSQPPGFIWTEAETILKTTIDATPLLKAAGIERETFFQRANLPTLLDTILHTDAPHCPPLARAYLFHAILQLILQHPVPEVTGLPFSPTLQTDARSFLSIISRSRRNLDDGMWLREGADIDWLNNAYGQWFRERKDRSYAREITDNVQELMDVTPQYAGHIAPDGTPITSPRRPSPLPPGTRIWYLQRPQAAATPERRAILSVGTTGAPLLSPLPLSPFFICQ